MSDDTCDWEAAQETPAVHDGGQSLLTWIFEALRHPRRRYTLYYLRDHDHASTDEVATYVAAQERGVAVDAVSADAVERVETALVHRHLPRLEEYGLIDYDRRSDAVSYAHPPSVLDEALELAAAFENGT